MPLCCHCLDGTTIHALVSLDHVKHSSFHFTQYLTISGAWSRLWLIKHPGLKAHLIVLWRQNQAAVSSAQKRVKRPAAGMMGQTEKSVLTLDDALERTIKQNMCSSFSTACLHWAMTANPKFPSWFGLNHWPVPTLNEWLPSLKLDQKKTGVLGLKEAR